VVETAVVGRPDEARGQIVVAYAVLRAGAAPDPDALRAFLTSELAPYKCPREFVFLDALPRTATGKLQRFRLRTHLTPAAGTAAEARPDANSAAAEGDHG
jgi:2-aminobenzoate-CoA ligase